MQVCKPYHYALVKAVEPFTLHPMSMAYPFEVYECLLRLWMGIWLHILIVITTDTSPDLWELGEFWPDASVKTMPLRFDWGCRTFQFSNCIPCPCHTYFRCLSAFSGCGWAYGFTLPPLPPQMFPQIFGSWVNSDLMQVCKPCHYALIQVIEPLKLHPMSMSYIWLHSHTITTILWINLLK